MSALIRQSHLVITFQNTESKSVPLNLSGIPAAEIFGPRSVTNSSKSTWPSPERVRDVDREREKKKRREEEEMFEQTKVKKVKG